jgi:hypothetical protein
MLRFNPGKTSRSDLFRLREKRYVLTGLGEALIFLVFQKIFTRGDHELISRAGNIF